MKTKRSRKQRTNGNFGKNSNVHIWLPPEVKYQHLGLLLRSHQENEKSEENDNFLTNQNSELLVREIQGRSPTILNRSVGKKIVYAQLQTESKKRATVDRKSKRLGKNSENEFVSVDLWWDKKLLGNFASKSLFCLCSYLFFYIGLICHHKTCLWFFCLDLVVWKVQEK